MKTDMRIILNNIICLKKKYEILKYKINLKILV